MDIIQSMLRTGSMLSNFDGSEDRSTIVVEFPCKFPEHTKFALTDMDIKPKDLVTASILPKYL